MKKNQTFEESLKRLEEIVKEMEDSQPDIDNAMKLFEEGISLVNQCSTKLDETKKKITQMPKCNLYEFFSAACVAFLLFMFAILTLSGKDREMGISTAQGSYPLTSASLSAIVCVSHGCKPHSFQG